MSNQPQRTFPDYGYSGDALGTPDPDLTEIPARMGSPVVYRRSGKVVFLERFFNRFGWIYSDTPATDLFFDTTGPNGHAMRMYAASWPTPTLSKYMPLFASRKFGLELSFCCSPTAQYLTFGVVTHDGATWTIYGIRIDNSSDLVQYLKPGSIYETIVSTPISNNFIFWHNIKVICDGAGGLIERVYFDNQEFELNVAAWNAASTDPPSISIFVGRQDVLSTNYFKVSDLILTIDES